MVSGGEVGVGWRWISGPLRRERWVMALGERGRKRKKQVSEAKKAPMKEHTGSSVALRRGLWACGSAPRRGVLQGGSLGGPMKPQHGLLQV